MLHELAQTKSSEPIEINDVRDDDTWARKALDGIISSPCYLISLIMLLFILSLRYLELGNLPLFHHTLM
jgi:hypothetical protein